MTAQWKKLGELLEIDEDRLDEIYTNNETDEECLRVMLQLWLQNPQANVTDALKTIGENQLAESLCLKCEISFFFHVDYIVAPIEYLSVSHEILLSSMNMTVLNFCALF